MFGVQRGNSTTNIHKPETCGPTSTDPVSRLIATSIKIQNSAEFERKADYLLKSFYEERKNARDLTERSYYALEALFDLKTVLCSLKLTLKKLATLVPKIEAIKREIGLDSEKGHYQRCLDEARASFARLKPYPTLESEVLTENLQYRIDALADMVKKILEMSEMSKMSGVTQTIPIPNSCVPGTDVIPNEETIPFLESYLAGTDCIPDEKTQAWLLYNSYMHTIDACRRVEVMRSRTSTSPSDFFAYEGVKPPHYYKVYKSCCTLGRQKDYEFFGDEDIRMKYERMMEGELRLVFDDLSTRQVGTPMEDVSPFIS